METMHHELRKHFRGIRFIDVPGEGYFPGKLVDMKQHAQPRHHIREYLRNFPSEKWNLDKMVNQNLIYGKKITHSVRIRFPVTLLGAIGIRLPKEALHDVDIEISEIFASEFFHTSELELRFELNRLRYIQKPLFREIRCMMVITEAFYARSFIVYFKRAAWEGKKIEDFLEADPAIQLAVTDNRIVSILSNDRFPFAIKGITF